MTEREKMETYQRVFGTGDGETVLDDLVAEFFEVVPYEPGVKQDINDTIFFEGCRHVIAHILYMVNPENAQQQDNVISGDYL